QQGLVETWDGVGWSATPSPQVGNGYTELTSVACVDGDSCVAVGESAADATLVETWDGASWSVAPSADPGTRYDQLRGVACGDVDSCVAIGYFQNFDTATANRARAGAPVTQEKRTLGESGPAVPRLRSPGAPTSVAATAHDGSATVTWSRPPAHGSKTTS